jgi:hypothetical protein
LYGIDNLAANCKTSIRSSILGVASNSNPQELRLGPVIYPGVAGPIIAGIALLVVALIALRSRRLRRRVKPDPHTGTALIVTQLKADVDSYLRPEH